MNNGIQKKTIKEITIHADKCVGCRACELACSAFHSTPEFSRLNPARARIRVYIDERKDIYVPVRATFYAAAECSGRQSYLLGAKEYNPCSFCGASCPSRDDFTEPDSGLPLKCDMCEGDPTLIEPWCVQACTFDALVYAETEDERTPEAEKPEELKAGLQALIEKYGMQKVVEGFHRRIVSQ